MLKQENITELIHLREKVLNNRLQTQLESLTKMFEMNQVSPKTFRAKKIELDQWATRERDKIHKNQQVIEKGLAVFQETVQRVTHHLSPHDYNEKFLDEKRYAVYEEDRVK